MGLHEPQSQTPEYPVTLTGTDKVIKTFNRNTTWVATGLLGSVIFAALTLALIGRDPKVDDLTGESSQTTSNILPNANPVAVSQIVDSNEKSTDEITSVQATKVDSGLTSGTNQPDMQANTTLWSSAQRPDPAAVIHTKISNVRVRSSLHPRYVDVKTRLVALWHQSLRREKSRRWSLFSSSDQSRRKIGYTAATSH